MMISQVQPVYATAATPYKVEEELDVDTDMCRQMWKIIRMEKRTVL